MKKRVQLGLLLLLISVFTVLGYNAWLLEVTPPERSYSDFLKKKTLERLEPALIEEDLEYETVPVIIEREQTEMEEEADVEPLFIEEEPFTIEEEEPEVDYIEPAEEEVTEPAMEDGWSRRLTCIPRSHPPRRSGFHPPV